MSLKVSNNSGMCLQRKINRSVLLFQTLLKFRSKQNHIGFLSINCSSVMLFSQFATFTVTGNVLLGNLEDPFMLTVTPLLIGPGTHTHTHLI